MVELSAQGLAGWKQCQLGCILIWNLWQGICFQALSGFWQNSLPCSCRTEFPVILLAGSGEQLSVPRGCSQILAKWPCPSQQQKIVFASNPLHALNLSDFPFWEHPEKNSLLLNGSKWSPCLEVIMQPNHRSKIYHIYSSGHQMWSVYQLWRIRGPI